MSFFNKFLGIKKETHSTPVTIANETVDQDGYVHLSRPVEPESHLVRQGNILH